MIGGFAIGREHKTILYLFSPFASCCVVAIVHLGVFDSKLKFSLTVLDVRILIRRTKYKLIIKLIA
jgi:hypothetical protein